MKSAFDIIMSIRNLVGEHIPADCSFKLDCASNSCG